MREAPAGKRGGGRVMERVSCRRRPNSRVASRLSPPRAGCCGVKRSSSDRPTRRSGASGRRRRLARRVCVPLGVPSRLAGSGAGAPPPPSGPAASRRSMPAAAAAVRPAAERPEGPSRPAAFLRAAPPWQRRSLGCLPSVPPRRRALPVLCSGSRPATPGSLWRRRACEGRRWWRRWVVGE